ncbi:chemotaxis protein CheW [Carboxylicivirga sp. M1479]|uniref:chemotaxis protein CheW n=1 Tax=Carboxylicivirga sp. M1479 TaxID=2594476 RepID=UPI0011782D2C|nr:chemotaxis protein CheW [Carboxylicivirga sp. M1479]TRX71639.1 chemotaxis protein CheW [Carboxylicivirga sp. M1479]
MNNSFLTFQLNNELFALGVEQVLEIIEASQDQKITHLPKAGHTIEGVVNFRGNVIPVINTRLKFDMDTYGADDKFVIMVLNLTMNGTEQTIGALADKVVDVIELEEKDVQSVPEVGQGINSEFIQGVVYRNDRFIMLLDMEKAISNDDIIQLKSEEEPTKEEELETA